MKDRFIYLDRRRIVSRGHNRMKEGVWSGMFALAPAFFDRCIEMRPMPRDYANFMINNQCSEGGHIVPITRLGMYYHNLKRGSLLRRLLRIIALTAAASASPSSLLTFPDILQLHGVTVNLPRSQQRAANKLPRCTIQENTIPSIIASE